MATSKKVQAGSGIMDQLLALVNTETSNFELGSLVEGTIIDMDTGKILVDLNGIATGLIAGRDMNDAGNSKATLQKGDTVSAVIIEDENAEGLIVLSLRKASQRKAWDRFKDTFEKKEIITVKATEANKGGLLLDMDGIKAFIPVSQLAPVHYPRVEGANSEKILERLQALLGIEFHVRIINIDEEGKKLILSERAAMEEAIQKSLTKLIPGQKLKGKISGIVSYGIFVTFDGLEGLVHISEIAWGHVSMPGKYGKVGDEVEVLVIGVDGGKISLSMKRLKSDPWIVIAEKYKIGDVVSGPVTRLTDFGAFVHIEQDINGLIHLSEIAHELVKDANEYLKVGQVIKAKIITLDLNEHRIGLSIKELLPKPEGMEEKEAEKKEKKAKAEKKEEEDKEEEAEKPAKKKEKEEVHEEKPAKKEKKEEEVAEEKPAKKKEEAAE